MQALLVVDGTGICYYEGHPSQSKEGAGQGAWAYHKVMEMRMVITKGRSQIIKMEISDEDGYN